MSTNKKVNQFVHIENTKRAKKCIVCWRTLPKGSLMKQLIKDETIYTNSVYCPTGTKHIESVNEYQEHLREFKKITDVVLLNKLGHDWELHRIRKGYLNIPDVINVTKAHREAYEQHLRWKVKKETAKLEKLMAQYKQKKDASIVKLGQLQAEIDDL